MPIDLLDTPLRVTWDLHGPHGPVPSENALRVAAALGEAGVFFVTLVRRPLLHPALGDLLKPLSEGGARIHLVAGGEEELERLSPGLPLQTLFLDLQPHLSPAAGLSAIERAVEAARFKGYDPALWLVPRRDNLHLLPSLLGFARERGIARIKLPNTPLDDTFSPSFAALPRPEDLDRLREILEENPLPLHEGMALEVHDLFLWELLLPGREEGRSEYGGCQAANTLAHVDAAGEVHPCSSWPQPLGSLLRHPLADIWGRSERRRVRAAIEAVPAGCSGCRDYPLCLGGCRGLGRLGSPAQGGRDPLCRGPRP